MNSIDKVSPKTPLDILSLPSSERREALNQVRAEVADRYLMIATTQMAIFDYIDTHFAAGNLNTDDLYDFILDTCKQNGFGEEDRIVAQKLYEKFETSYSAIQSLRGLSDEEIVNSLRRAPDAPAPIQGKYQVRLTPYAAEITFENRPDFMSFSATDSSDEAKEKYQYTAGISYVARVGDTTIPAVAKVGEATNVSDADSTTIHEERHKKSALVNLKNPYTKEGVIKEELLSFYDASEQGASNINILDPYPPSATLGTGRYLAQRVGSKHYIDVSGMPEDEYSQVMTNAIQAMYDLKKRGEFSKEEILALLSTEGVQDWSKVARRVLNYSQIAKDQRKQRKAQKREAFMRDQDELTAKSYQKLVKELNGNQEFAIAANSNASGTTYQNITADKISSMLNKKGIEVKPEQIDMTTITKLGTYAVSLLVGGERVGINIEVTDPNRTP